jgi:hypothetical protein
MQYLIFYNLPSEMPISSVCRLSTTVTDVPCKITLLSIKVSRFGRISAGYALAAQQIRKPCAMGGIWRDFMHP